MVDRPQSGQKAPVWSKLQSWALPGPNLNLATNTEPRKLPLCQKPWNGAGFKMGVWFVPAQPRTCTVTGESAGNSVSFHLPFIHSFSHTSPPLSRVAHSLPEKGRTISRRHLPCRKKEYQTRRLIPCRKKERSRRLLAVVKGTVYSISFGYSGSYAKIFS